jgi:hypothetical protein
VTIGRVVCLRPDRTSTLAEPDLSADPTQFSRIGT